MYLRENSIATAQQLEQAKLPVHGCSQFQVSLSVICYNHYCIDILKYMAYVFRCESCVCRGVLFTL